jgi:phosphate transport system permease protein
MTADHFSSDETVLVEIQRGAVLNAPRVPEGRDPVAVLNPSLVYRSDRARTRTVPSLGVDDLVRRSQVVGGAGGAVARDDTGLGWAWPARLSVTDRRILGVGTDGTVWSWATTEVIEAVHSATEPCTVIRYPGMPDHALLVPLPDADRFRGALDQALDEVAVPVEAAVATPPAGVPALPALIEAAVPARGVAGDVPAGVPFGEGAVEAGPPPRRIRAVPGVGDRVFHGWSWAAGLSVLAIMALVGLFLLVRALTALKTTGLSFLTTAAWQPDTHHFGIAAVLTGTVLIAIVALAVAIPLATGTALFISECAPRALKQWFISGVDLMAAVPSIVFGLWGLFFLQGHVIGLSRWISTWFSWIPIFKVRGADPHNPLASSSVYTSSTFIAGLVVALMVIPISCSIMREVFSQAPSGEREGAYALGATRWGMIQSVVLPFAKGGMIGAVMLGLGRALGETIAVYLIISPVFQINWHVLQAGSNSVASLIVLRQGDASGFGLSALMAAGLALFVLTLVVNFSASAIVARSRSGAQSEA